MCLIVNNDGQEEAFVTLTKDRYAFVDEIIPAIQEVANARFNDHIQHGLILYKPCIEIAEPEQAKLLFQPSISENLKELEVRSTLSKVFEAEEPLNPDLIHIIAQLPPGKPPRGLEVTHKSMPHEGAITFTIPMRAEFTKLTKSSISPDEVEHRTDSPSSTPSFIKEFRQALGHQRALPNVSVAAASPLLFFLPYTVRS